MHTKPQIISYHTLFLTGGPMGPGNMQMRPGFGPMGGPGCGPMGPGGMVGPGGNMGGGGPMGGSPGGPMPPNSMGGGGPGDCGGMLTPPTSSESNSNGGGPQTFATVKASAPNTIQYLPSRPNFNDARPKGPPSLEFLQK